MTSLEDTIRPAGEAPRLAWPAGIAVCPPSAAVRRAGWREGDESAQPGFQSLDACQVFVPEIHWR